MNLDQKSILSLKYPVLIGFVVLWNLGFLVAYLLGRDEVEGVFSSISSTTIGIVCTIASLFCLSVARSKSIQSIVVSEKRAENFKPDEFYFVALISGVLGVSNFF